MAMGDVFFTEIASTVDARCQSPKYENGFLHLWHLALGNV